MGGLGSGNHYHYWRGSKKTIVENCHDIDANRWTREGILKAGSTRAGSWRWTYRSGRDFSVNYEVNTLDLAAAWVRLSYSWVWAASQQGASADYCVRLTTTRPRFGGLRWWFLCPLVINGWPCERRAGKLYLPPHGRYFGCRQCHELTYRSVQEHDKRADMLRKHPGLMATLLDGMGPPSLRLLAAKATLRTMLYPRRWEER
jgi:hypothetical protein